MTIAAQHHEKLDGTGYPNGLKGSDLNELARMAAIVDVFGALTDLRVYKPPFMPAEALDYMRNMGPDHLDQNLVKMFRSMLLDTASLLRAI
jgi:HD-GYP domain-containing protein (c-di-GMP phosphodiesterase class II)